ncbi:hypothetical protein [Candidatus Sororendozoicomonas aggregata]|uniref:hypothetical protein n=1 Tax=Candidatus Sororendozoicomonas aggregata TaxID=3073239 RepID=UPI002ED55ED9
MNEISLSAIKINDNKKVVIDGVEFNRGVLVDLKIDNRCCRYFEHMEHSVVVLRELVRSLSGNGCYLIFTSASGIADDGGWEGVTVTYMNDVVNWDFEIEDIEYHYEFDLQQYKKQIMSLELSLEKVINEVEPTEIYFPESWE